MGYEDNPDTLRPLDRYLQVAREVLTLDGYRVVGELSFGGYEYLEGIRFLAVHFTDERSGTMRYCIPSPQFGSQEGAEEI